MAGGLLRVLLDTNVLVSAALSSASVPYQAYVKALQPPFQATVTEQNLREFTEVFQRKFPAQLQFAEEFVHFLRSSVDVIPVAKMCERHIVLRDPEDEPILRAALREGFDVIF